MIARDASVIEFLQSGLHLQKIAGAGFPRIKAAMSRGTGAKCESLNMELEDTGDINVQHLLKEIATRFVRDESGATAIEYGLIAVGISVAIILVVNTLGIQVGTTFSNVSSSLANAGK